MLLIQISNTGREGLILYTYVLKCFHILNKRSIVIGIHDCFTKKKEEGVVFICSLN